MFTRSRLFSRSRYVMLLLPFLSITSTIHVGCGLEHDDFALEDDGVHYGYGQIYGNYGHHE